MEKINVTVENGVKTLEIRTGEALELREPKIVNIVGTAETPLEWLKQRKEQIQPKKAHLIVDVEKGTISLKEDETNPYGATITGQLEISPIFIKFGINSGEYKTPIEMSEFIKMNRVYFENRQEAMELVTKLRQFKAKVNKEVEQEVNLNKGDRRILLAQAVDSNIPPTFNVCLPLFKGVDKEIFEVETYFNPDDLTCTLVSPMANERFEEIKSKKIDEIVSAIKTECPDIVIVFQ